MRVFPRGDVPVQAQWIPEPQSNQWVAIIQSGVNFIVDNVPSPDNPKTSYLAALSAIALLQRLTSTLAVGA